MQSAPSSPEAALAPAFAGSGAASMLAGDSGQIGIALHAAADEALHFSDGQRVGLDRLVGGQPLLNFVDGALPCLAILAAVDDAGQIEVSSQ